MRRRKSRVSTNATALACSVELTATDLVNPSTTLPRESRHMEGMTPQLGVEVGLAALELEASPPMGSMARETQNWFPTSLLFRSTAVGWVTLLGTSPLFAPRVGCSFAQDRSTVEEESESRGAASLLEFESRWATPPDECNPPLLQMAAPPLGSAPLQTRLATEQVDALLGMSPLMGSATREL